MMFRIPLGIHDYATGKKIQKNFQLVAQNGSHIELRGRGTRNLWMKSKSGQFWPVADGSTLPLKYAKKVAVYLVWKTWIWGDDFKAITKAKIKAVAQRTLCKKHYKNLD